MGNNKIYEIKMEIAGPLAMWARPDTGSTPTSYPVPTWSAAKGIFESIAFLSDGRAWIRPTKVEICKKLNSKENNGNIHFQKYTTNYHGPLKEKNKSNFQFSSLVLSEVCYRLYAVIENGSGYPLAYGDNPCHHLQAMFERRLAKGQCHKTPSLGWNEFTPSYWGLFRDKSSISEIQTVVDVDINLNLISILKQVFDAPVSGKYSPLFLTKEQAFISRGEFKYD